MRSKTFVVGDKKTTQRPLFSDMLKISARKTVRDFPDLAVLAGVITGAVFVFKSGVPTMIDVAQNGGLAVVGSTSLNFAIHLVNAFRKNSKIDSSKPTTPSP